MKKYTTKQPCLFGRTPRSRDPRVPHLSALIAGRAQHRPPERLNYAEGLPSDLGLMLNNILLDCSCAAFYHARQVWTFHSTGSAITEPDSNVKQMYIEACGYNPEITGPGPGGNLQAVLHYLLKIGAPIGPEGLGRNKIDAFLEVDPRNVDDVKLSIYKFGLVYVGFPVPSNLSPYNDVWDYSPEAKPTNQSHAVVICGYDQQYATAISSGRFYRITWPFFTHYIDEVYAIVSSDWMQSSPVTSVLELNVAEIKAAMVSFA